MLILGIETSCDDTSVAVLENGKIIRSNIVSSQDRIHSLHGGIFPELAARQHIENISLVYESALREADVELKDIDYIASTYSPGLIGSLLVGFSFSKSLSFSSGIPLIPVHHIKGHIYSTFIENDISLPAIALVVSGGHTSLIYIDEKHNFKEIGHTLDDAAGETYDKVGRMLELPFPGGPIIDKLASQGEANIEMPNIKVEGYNFSFSGLKTFMLNFIRKNSFKIEDLCASFQSKVVDILVNKSIKACLDKRVKSFMLAGGVAANSLLRDKINIEGNKNSINVYIPSKKLCIDNGAMIASAAYQIIKNEKDILKNPLTRPSLSIERG